MAGTNPKINAITGDTKEELMLMLELLKHKYKRVIKIHPKRRGCSMWIAEVEV